MAIRKTRTHLCYVLLLLSILEYVVTSGYATVSERRSSCHVRDATQL